MNVILLPVMGLLVDGQAMRQCYRHNMAQIMSARYGKPPEFWQKVDQDIVLDWDSYHADLNFSGDEGIADMHEARFRLTRALFLLANIPEPPKPEITALANELAQSPCDESVLLPDATKTATQLHARGYKLAVYGYFLQDQLGAMTVSLPEIDTHIGADTLNHYEHDKLFFTKLATYFQTNPGHITVVTDSHVKATHATQAGLVSLLVGKSPVSHTHILEFLPEE